MAEAASFPRSHWWNKASDITEEFPMQSRTSTEKQSKRFKSDRGSVMVEFAVTLPLLLGLCMAATDFGRIFYHAVTISNAAGVGAFYGARNSILIGANERQQERALDEMRNITASADSEPVDVVAERKCKCPDADWIDCDEAATVVCGGGYGAPRAYVKVTVSQPFPSFAPWPILPSNTIVSKTAFQRVQ